MSNTQELLEMAIAWYGLNDIVTIMLSQQIDKEVTKEQEKRYEAYKEDLNNGRIYTSFN
jgi:hypothetical protein